MIANVSAHRRANAFAQALEEQSDRDTAAEQSAAPAGTPPATEEHSGQGALLTLAEGLGALPKPQLDPEVKVVQRAQLVAAMEAMLQEGTGAADTPVPGQRSHRAGGAHRASPLGKLRPRSRLSKGLAAGGLSVTVAAGAFGGVAAASSDALPGDSLYGLKRGIADFKLNYLSDGDDERGQTYLDQASTRLSEARRLMERGRGGHLDHESIGEIRRTLAGMQHDVTEGHRLLRAAYEADPGSLGPIQALSSFSQSHRRAWSALSDRLPVQLGDVKDQVSSVFDAIDEEVAPLRSLLPQQPAQSGDGKRPGGSGPTSTDSSGAHRSAEPSSGGSPSSGRHASPGTPSGSATASSGGGLIGGDTGGLLDPPHTGTGSSTPPIDRLPTSAPDVTLPPLLPGLLPGLGIDNEDAD
ncbi:hypothetical protein GCM10010503_64260 [Streptomyces lucensis JCM 4490]|uniref:DUF5667 domain-containing protein n=1 Tax=Streptomyces lucensis JCM 4490 TaxID=1306176 RepID=A0A918JHK2_9ACTN|nr:DUF5667 domain-containing protein [Streptomyces lucensis]GGW77640.1 hypothetical protein GCM10010503_64260 [Streptomyces lucensis JCM 4490]